MTFEQMAVAWSVEAALALLAAGLIVRRRRCATFIAYVATVFLGELSVLVWPGVFWVYGWYITRQLAYGTLKLAIGSELAIAIFAAFPGAQRAAKRVAAMFLVLTFASLTMLPDGGAYTGIYAELLPRFSNGALWLFTGLAAVSSWYRVPLHPIQKAILVGFVAYGVPFSILLALLGLTQWRTFEAFNALAPLAYLAAVTFWAWRAWTAEEPEYGPGLARLLGVVSWN